MVSLVAALALVAAVLFIAQRASRSKSGWKAGGGGASAVSLSAIQAGYSAPIDWRNVYAPTRPMKGVNVYIREFPTYNEARQFKEQRSNMSQFRLWYSPFDYLNANERVKSPTPSAWMETIDGNPALGSDVNNMPIFIQRPFKGKGDRLARLYLYEITSEQAKRLTSGPLREENFDVVNYETRQPEVMRLKVGVEGGRFRDPVRVQTSSAHGTAQPSRPAPVAPHGTAEPSSNADMGI